MILFRVLTCGLSQDIQAMPETFADKDAAKTAAEDAHASGLTAAVIPVVRLDAEDMR